MQLNSFFFLGYLNVFAPIQKGSGNHLGLTVILNADVSEYYCASSSTLGFRVLVHGPHELPEIDEYGLSIANGYDSRIVVTPIISRASDAVRHIPMKIRQCLYENENFLKLYRLVGSAIHSLPSNSIDNVQNAYFSLSASILDE